ncbi:beta-glucosidase 24 isoform X3 [Manihot esculenta]|uniref:Uncharacterized protein n=1 Tax=Manihot esculenta TaxID=3983 RepID=A0ACB7GIZ9_MANES|nr:beta-glucosidase 24 isoform X3 [Manihot esculenta]KAG8638711.1 hypothetical protein MANES_14G053600v8 [Manihot esculenta]
MISTASRALGLPLMVESQIALNFDIETSIRRTNFPSDFLFGASTAALQIEGSTKSEGRARSIWDTYLENHRDKVIDGSNMDTAIDSYKRYKEDMEHLKNLGVDAYRFSISWTRILPDGTLSGGVNQEAIDHYNKMIDMLIEYGIKPFATLFHFDSPQALDEKYGGFLSSSIVGDFQDYSEVCFRTFGDRVKNWITINEPLMIAQLGYDLGIAPPGRCSGRANCEAGNSSTEPYIVSHNLLLAHAAAARLYKNKYQAKQGGEIGISLVGQYYEPYSESLDDKAAQERALDFQLGWYMEPLVYGDYPNIMRELVKDRLPIFTEHEKKLVKDSFDFIGINYYTSIYAKAIPIDPNATHTSYTDDQFIYATAESKDGELIGPKFEGMNIYVYPEGLQKVLELIKEKYQSPKIYITENGITEARNDNRGLVEALDDLHRIEYIQRHLYRVHKAIKNGVNVRGYFYWSLFDSFEWLGGYTIRFGLYYIDYKDNLKRIPKVSSMWYHHFLQGGRKQAY